MNTKQEHLLRLLKEIDSFCKDHNITYYCAAGTVLGAIRHGGFIPWDDDIDILMTRDEFLRFATAMKTDGPENRSVEYFEGNHEHHSTVARYVNKDSTMFSHYHITGYSPAGIFIDIFVLDPVPDDHDDLVRHVADFYAYADLVAPTLSHSSRLPSLYSHVIDEYIEKSSRNGIYETAEELSRRLFSYDGSSCSNYMLRWASQPFIYPKEYFGRPEMMSFEDMMVPVPSKWPQYLAAHYGFGWTDIPSQDNRDYHDTVFDPDRDYNEVYSLRDSMYEQDKLYKLHRDMQTARRESDALYHTLEDYADGLHIRLCEIEVRHNYEDAGLPYDPLKTAAALIEQKRYKVLTDLYEPYLNLQTREAFMGARRHGTYYHMLFPVIVPIDSELLQLLLRALLYTGRLNEVLKIEGIYRRSGLADAKMSEIRELLDKISTVYGLYYQSDYSGTLDHIHEISEYSEIPQLRDYEWLSLVHTGMDASMEQKLRELSKQSSASEELKKAYGDLLFKHGDITGAGDVYMQLLKDSRNGMFLRDIISKGFEFDMAEWSRPAADSPSALSERIAVLEEELDGLCREHNIKLYRHSIDNEEGFFMTASSACSLLKDIGSKLPADRSLVSWKTGSAVNAFDILYADTSTVDCNLRYESDLSSSYAAVRIRIIRRAALGMPLAAREKLVRIMDLNPYSAGRQPSQKGRLACRQITALPDQLKIAQRKGVFNALMKKELKNTGEPSEKDLRRTIKKAYRRPALAPSILLVQSVSVSCDDLFTAQDKKRYEALPWFEYIRARISRSKLDDEVVCVWEDFQTAASAER